MNKNTLTAFVLMAVVVFGFMTYENYTRRNQMEEQLMLDSIAQVEAQKEAKEQQKKLEKMAEERTDTLNPLHEAYNGKEDLTVIENELLRVTLTNRGGQMKKVELKDSSYKSRNGGIDGSLHVVARTVVQLWLHVGQFHVLLLLVPSARAARIDFADGSQIDDVALLQHLRHRVHAQLEGHPQLRLVHRRVATGVLHNVVELSRAVGQYTGNETCLFGYRLLAVCFLDFQFQLCHSPKFLMLNKLFDWACPIGQLDVPD